MLRKNNKGAPTYRQTVAIEVPLSDLVRVLRESDEHISRSIALELCGVHRTTFDRWMRGDARIPRAAYELLRIVGSGMLPGMCPKTWRGWRFRGSDLLDPAGRRHTPSSILTAYYWEMAAAAHRARCEAIERELAALVAQGGAGCANDVCALYPAAFGATTEGNP